MKIRLTRFVTRAATMAGFEYSTLPSTSPDGIVVGKIFSFNAFRRKGMPRTSMTHDEAMQAGPMIYFHVLTGGKRWKNDFGVADTMAWVTDTRGPATITMAIRMASVVKAHLPAILIVRGMIEVRRHCTTIWTRATASMCLSPRRNPLPKPLRVRRCDMVRRREEVNGRRDEVVIPLPAAKFLGFPSRPISSSLTLSKLPSSL